MHTTFPKRTRRGKSLKFTTPFSPKHSRILTLPTGYSSSLRSLLGSDIQGKVMNMLERIVTAATRSGSTACKAPLSCRISQGIAKEIRRKQPVSLSNLEERGNIEKTIGRFATKRLGTLRPQFFEVGIKDVEIKTLELRMFLYARLVLEYIATNFFFNREETLRAADTLPQKLSEFYGQILAQLTSHFDDRSVSRMKLILGWIAFANRPLRKTEFRSALTFSSGEEKAQELAPQHFSIFKDFLQGPDSSVAVSQEAAVYEQGLATVTCLLAGLRIFTPSCPERERSLHVLQGLHGFHTYAGEYWGEYLLSYATSPNYLDTSSKFFVLSCKLSETLKHTFSGGGDGQDSTLPDSAISTDLVKVTSLEALTYNYEHTIKRLLALRSYPGVTIHEFERFKQ
ncbi:NACHT domain protein [Zalerion maritima]|uniref:NACHT domain protein n=1 Tax=Zalerion maritima TaxID=339359 RepID=A0AAD5RZD3_9PEZI|nr:NACHT domain protein [Zalerion maritima]